MCVATRALAHITPKWYMLDNRVGYVAYDIRILYALRPGRRGLIRPSKINLASKLTPPNARPRGLSSSILAHLARLKLPQDFANRGDREWEIAAPSRFESRVSRQGSC
eukprot:4088531-Pleurochrysis_carterae.AAC.1